MRIELDEADLRPEFVNLPTSEVRFEHLTGEAQHVVHTSRTATFYRNKGTPNENYNRVYFPGVQAVEEESKPPALETKPGLYRHVFRVSVRPGEERGFARAWQGGSKPIQKMPGARGTHLHIVTDKKGNVVPGSYIAIAEWESHSARGAAFEALEQSGPNGDEWRKWPDNSDFGTVTFIGGLIEIDAVFPPKNT